MLQFMSAVAAACIPLGRALAVGACMVLITVAVPVTACAGMRGDLQEDRGLESDLESYLSLTDGSYGMAVINLNDGRTAGVNDETPFPTASMYKLLVMYRAFQAIQRGDLSSDGTLMIEDDDVVQDEPDAGFAPGDRPTVHEALEAMITVSSNAAAFALTREVGGWQEIELAAGELGMTRTENVDGDFISTPSDMAHFFELLASRSLVSQAASEEMIALLLRQTVNDRLPALLPSDTAVAHKTGELDDIRNDGGIVEGTNGQYIVVVMSRGGAPDDEVQAEAELSKIVYRAYGE